MKRAALFLISVFLLSVLVSAQSLESISIADTGIKVQATPAGAAAITADKAYLTIPKESADTFSTFLAAQIDLLTELESIQLWDDSYRDVGIFRLTSPEFIRAKILLTSPGVIIWYVPSQPAAYFKFTKATLQEIKAAYEKIQQTRAVVGDKQVKVAEAILRANAKISK